jgi:CDP-diacylglycerol--serine O-phosphatidyltransferase
MKSPHLSRQKVMSSDSVPDPKIYLLPNLMTAGNLFCGFAATLKILTATVQMASAGEHVADNIHAAILFILGACVFDLLDGRLARLGGNESAFGREFDSIADTVSFGLAPALLVYKIVLEQFDRLGLIVAFVYLLCGAMRLARFNCIAAAESAVAGEQSKIVSESVSNQFKGFPIPAAAGLIASLTMLMLWLEEGKVEIGWWKYLLPPLMLFLSFMMFSQFRYPSFKAIHWRTQRTLPTFLGIIVVVVFAALNYQWMPAVLFLTYLMYGFLRPWISRSWRRGIERGLEDEPESTDGRGQ